MKHSAIFKDIFREIWKTKNRFLSILAIIALGAGFFAGVKATCPDMKLTAEKYYRDNNLMDFHLLSTYGVTDEDVDALRSLDGVKDCTAGYSADVLTNVGGSDEVTVKVLSAGDTTINKPDLIEGRLPEKSGECVVESQLHSPGNFKIGETLTLVSGDKDAPLSDTLKTESYEIVGIVRSPLYINFQRGSTSIGNGKVDCFIMVPEEDFALEVYTDAYVTLYDTEGVSAFDSRYQGIIDGKEAEFTAFADERAQLRYDDLTGEAKHKIADARSELEEARETANRELADAQQKLSDGQSQLADAKAKLKKEQDNFNATIADANKQISDGRTQLADAQSQLDGKKQETSQTFDALQKSIDGGYAQLLQTEAALIAAGQYTDQAKAQIKQARDELDQKQSQLDAQKSAAEKQLAGAQSEINGNTAALSQKEQELKVQTAAAQAEFRSAQAQIAQSDQELADGQKEYDTQKTEAEQKLQDAEDEINENEQKISEISLPKWYVLDRGSNPGYSDFETDAQRVDNVAAVFPIFFILVVVLVCSTTMTRLVEEHRTQIGTLKSLGYGKGAIMLKYLLYAFLASLIGSLLGLLVCMKLFPIVIFNAYETLYIMPPVVAPYHWNYLVFCTLVAILCTGLAAFFSCYAELMSRPAQLLRPKSPKSGKRVLLERFSWLWSKFSFIYKVTIRNISRYKKRVLMTIIGIAGCTALMLTGFGLEHSISSIVSKQFEDIFTYDTIVAVDDEATEEDFDGLMSQINRNSNVVQSMATLQKTVDVTFGSTVKEATMFVPQSTEEISDYVALQTRKEKTPITLDDSGVVINEKLAKLLKVKLGESITLQKPTGERVELPVTGITENYTLNYIYLSPAAYENAFGQAPEFNTIVLNSSGDEVKDQLSTDLINLDHVMAVSFSSDSGNQFRDVVSSLNYIVLIVIISAGALAFIVLYNLTNVNVAERIRELATIKVLGFYDGEVSAYIYRENIFCTIIGIALGLFGGIFLERFVVNTAEVDVVMFTPEINLMSFVLAAVLTALFTLIVNLVLYFKLKKIDMVESLKSIE